MLCVAHNINFQYLGWLNLSVLSLLYSERPEA